MTLSKSNKGTHRQITTRRNYAIMYREFRKHPTRTTGLTNTVGKAARTSYKHRPVKFTGWTNKNFMATIRRVRFENNIDWALQQTRHKNHKPSKLSHYEELINKLARAAQNYRIHDKLVNSKVYTQPGGTILDGKFVYMEHSLRMTQAARYCQQHNMKIPERLLDW